MNMILQSVLMLYRSKFSRINTTTGPCKGNLKQDAAKNLVLSSKCVFLTNSYKKCFSGGR